MYLTFRRRRRRLSTAPLLVLQQWVRPADPLKQEHRQQGCKDSRHLFCLSRRILCTSIVCDGAKDYHSSLIKTSNAFFLSYGCLSLILLRTNKWLYKYYTELPHLSLSLSLFPRHRVCDCSLPACDEYLRSRWDVAAR